MSVRYIHPTKGLRKLIASLLRAWYSPDRKMKLWRKSLDVIFKEKGYAHSVPLFQSIEIETRTRCNSGCSFCGASILHDTRPDVYMPDEMLDTIFTELKALNYAGFVRFFVNNEPLLDKRLANLVKRVKEELPLAICEIQTNGLKLNEKNGEEILRAGVDRFYINNYSDEETIHIGVKLFLEKVAPRFPQTEVQVSIRKLNQTLNNRGGTAPNATYLPQPLPLPCTLPFSDLVITASGKVAICCQDLNFNEVMGQFPAQSLREIWMGPAFQRHRQALLQSNRKASPLCEGCDYRGFKDESISGILALKNRIAGTLIQKT